MATTGEDAGRRRRPPRSVAVLVAAALLVGGGATWAARTVAETHRVRALDPTVRALVESRERLHEEIGAVRYEHPDSTGRTAVRELIEGTGRSFRFVAEGADGTTTAEVLLLASATIGFVKAHDVTTSVCLEVTVAPRSFWGGRGPVTSQQTPCTTTWASVTPEYADDPPRSVVLDHLSTAVHRPAPTPEPEQPPRPRPPVCYSGSDCSESGG